MDIDERLNRISEDVQFLLAVQRSHDDQIAKLIEEGASTDRKMKELQQEMRVLTQHTRVLTEHTKNAMDAIGRLAHIAAAHEDRLDGHDQRLDDLE